MYSITMCFSKLCLILEWHQSTTFVYNRCLDGVFVQWFWKTRFLFHSMLLLTIVLLLLDQPYANTVLNTGVKSHLQQSKYPHACHKVQCKLKERWAGIHEKTAYLSEVPGLFVNFCIFLKIRNGIHINSADLRLVRLNYRTIYKTKYIFVY